MIVGLDIEDLSVARGDRVLFQKFGLNLAAGEAAALTGRNGAGKTSLLRTIAGLIRPLQGVIRFRAEAGELPAEDARSRELHLIGHQDGLKAGRTAWDELKFQVAWTGGAPGAAEAACERLDLMRLRGLEVRKLSAGQRRRLALARLVASPRRLWLLDEPLAPLDTERRIAFGALMQAHLAEGGMVLAAVHDPLPIAARVVELSV
jgi:heme exporter protein A